MTAMADHDNGLKPPTTKYESLESCQDRDFHIKQPRQTTKYNIKMTRGKTH